MHGVVVALSDAADAAPPAPDGAGPSAELERLLDLTDAMLGHACIRTLVDEFLPRLRDVLRVDVAQVLLLEGDELVSGGTVGAAPAARTRLGEGLGGIVAAERRPFRVADLTVEPGLDAALLAAGLRSLAAVPLVVGGQVGGQVGGPVGGPVGGLTGGLAGGQVGEPVTGGFHGQPPGHVRSRTPGSGGRPPSRHTDGEVVGVLLVGTRTAASLGLGEVRLLQRAAARLAIVVRSTQVEAELRESQAKAQAVLDTAGEAIVTMDERGRIDTVNRAYLALFGYAEGELVGQDVSLLIPGPAADQHARYVERYLQTGQNRIIGRGREVEALRRDGTTFPIDLHVTVVNLGDRRLFTAVIRDITERRRAEAELRYQALHDPLTGLANRVLFGDHLDAALARHVRSGRRLAVLFLDLDRFKMTNDSLGHAAGDMLLRQVAGRLRGAVRPGDTIARLSGDEFAVLLEDVTAEADVTRVAHRIQMLFADPFQVENEQVRSTCSIGIAATRGQHSASDLLRHADAALYRAKEGGRGRYEMFDEPMQRWLGARVRTGNELRRGFAEGEIEVHYQPLRALSNTGVGAVTGYEALARWRHPRRGLLPAGAFIELAEESGLVVPLGAAVLDQVGRDRERWFGRLHRGAPEVAVNLSPQQLALPSIVELLAPAAQRGPLWIEISETTLMSDVGRSAQRLADLRRLGIRVAVDDFGTGHSSLAYLKRFPVDAIKIDRTFIDRLGQDADDTAIVSAIISLGHTLGLRVIAEGVERPAQLGILAHLECDGVQGYLTGPPAPADALAADALAAPRLTT